MMRRSSSSFPGSDLVLHSGSDGLTSLSSRALAATGHRRHAGRMFAGVRDGRATGRHAPDGGHWEEREGVAMAKPRSIDKAEDFYLELLSRGDSTPAKMIAPDLGFKSMMQGIADDLLAWAAGADLGEEG